MSHKWLQQFFSLYYLLHRCSATFDIFCFYHLSGKMKWSIRVDVRGQAGHKQLPRVTTGQRRYIAIFSWQCVRGHWRTQLSSSGKAEILNHTLTGINKKKNNTHKCNLVDGVHIKHTVWLLSQCDGNWKTYIATRRFTRIFGLVQCIMEHAKVYSNTSRMLSEKPNPTIIPVGAG